MNIFKEIMRDNIGRIGFFGVLLVLIFGILAPFIAPHSPTEMFTNDLLSSPSGQFIFGTDEYGYDVFSRVVYGARVSMYVGVVSVAIASIIGSLLGLIAGYFGGWIDNIIMRFMDILFAFPSILLALAIVSVLGTELINTIISIGIVMTPVFTRTVRAAVISVKSKEFITSAVSIGIKDSRIIFKHVLPNVMAPFIVQMTLSLSSAILVEASLSFLGLGIQPPDPSWGSMLNLSRKYMELAPWTAIFPAVAIIFTILSFNLLGDSLRDILDPKLKI
ncbi:MAG: ABC transporter permease [Firmicutes bacterium]|jgi:ABC-type dipeptide/oligopeptide/nickel transport system permease subunit|nr:ABC transporter permease [Bacillota bacterium]